MNDSLKILGIFIKKGLSLYPGVFHDFPTFSDVFYTKILLVIVANKVLIKKLLLNMFIIWVSLRSYHKRFLFVELTLMPLQLLSLLERYFFSCFLLYCPLVLKGDSRLVSPKKLLTMTF